MKHVTHFNIESKPISHQTKPPYVYYIAYAYLNASSLRPNPLSPSSSPTMESNQARIIVCQGTEEECEQFIAEKTYLDEAFQWIGYLVAGGIGAILTRIFQNASP